MICQITESPDTAPDLCDPGEKGTEPFGLVELSVVMDSVTENSSVATCCLFLT